MTIKSNTFNKKQPTIEDLMKWFLLKSPMSQKKLQKLIYYSQAWSLVFLGEDIVNGIKFQAWVHGPVNYQLRTMLAEFGWNEIELSTRPSEKEVNSTFSDKQLEVLNEVWNAYGRFSADQLEVLTHREEPWLEKRLGLEPYEASANEISNETMKKFYSKMVVE